MNLSAKKFTMIFLGNMAGVISGFVIASILISNSGMYNYGYYVTMIAIISTISVFFKPLTWISILKYSSQYSLGAASAISITVEATNSIFLYGLLHVLELTIASENSYFNFIIDYKFLLCFYVFVVNSGFSLGLSRFREKYNFISIVNFLSAVSKVILAVTLFYDVKALVFYTILSDVLLWSSFFVFNILSVKISFTNIKGFLGTSYTANFINIVDLPVNQLDRIIVTALAGEDISAIFSLIRRLSMLVNQLSDPVYQLYYKEFSKESFILRTGVLKESFLSVFRRMWMVVVAGLIAYPFVINHIDSFFFADKLVYFHWLLYSFIMINSLCVFFVWLNPLFYLHVSQSMSLYITIVANFIYMLSIVIVFKFFNVYISFVPLFLQCITNYALKFIITNNKSECLVNE